MVASLTEPSKKDVPFFIGVQSSTELRQCAGFFLKKVYVYTFSTATQSSQAWIRLTEK